MHERIRELVMGSVNFRLDPDSNHYEAQVQPEDLELFAELIVQECINTFLSVPTGYKDYRSQIEEAMRDDCVAAVKRHFGVEE